MKPLHSPRNISKPINVLATEDDVAEDILYFLLRVAATGPV